MPVEHTGQLLVRMDPAARVRAEAAWPDSEPLFLNEAERTTGAALAPATHWRLHRLPPVPQADDHPWDAAHAFVARAGERGVGVYAEPDLVHRRPVAVRTPEGEVRARTPVREGKPVDRSYPPADGPQVTPAWHLERARFPDAWKITPGKGVRIAHLDTGYCPHMSTPEGLIPAAGRNFYQGNPTDVTDPGTGWNAGHGTATLALVAGKTVDLEYFDGKGHPGAVYKGPIGRGGAPSGVPDGGQASAWRGLQIEPQRKCGQPSRQHASPMYDRW